LNRLSPIDLGVIALYFVAISAIAWQSRAPRDDSSRDFMLGERRIPWWAAMLSIIGTELSALTFVGVPAHAFSKSGNYTYLMAGVGMILARIIVSKFFVPAYYKHNVISIYELLEHRFGPMTRSMAVAIFMFTRVAMSGVRLYAGSIVLEQALGLSWQWAIALTTLVGMVYTIVGGIKSVIWTEVMQVCVMFGGACVAAVVLFMALPDGWHSVTTATAGLGKFQVFDFRFSMFDDSQEFTVWACLIGMTFFNLSIMGTDYDMVQRMLTTKDEEKSARAVVTSALADIPLSTLFLTIGVLLYTYYLNFPDPSLPAENGKVLAKDVFPYFIVTRIPHVFAGLVVAGILSVALSSFQSALNALSTSFTVDVYRRFIGRDLEDSRYVAVTRVATAGFAALLMGVAFWSSSAHDILILGLEIPSYTYCALLGVFLVGIFSGRGTDRSCTLAMIYTVPFVLFVCHLWIGFAWTWNAMFGTLFSMALAVGLDFLGPRREGAS
jgi:SSS family transporter